MDELIKIIKRLRLTKSDLLMEAECIEEYGEWMHMALLGYDADELREAAKQMFN